jgi:hypothetical protein
MMTASVVAEDRSLGSDDAYLCHEISSYVASYIAEARAFALAKHCLEPGPSTSSTPQGRRPFVGGDCLAVHLHANEDDFLPAVAVGFLPNPVEVCAGLGVLVMTV